MPAYMYLGRAGWQYAVAIRNKLPRFKVGFLWVWRRAENLVLLAAANFAPKSEGRIAVCGGTVFGLVLIGDLSKSVGSPDALGRKSCREKSAWRRMRTSRGIGKQFTKSGA